MTDHQKVQYELNSTRDAILESAREVKDQAIRLQKELDDVILLADQVIEKVEDAIHFPADPWTSTSWKSLPTTATKLDTMIRSYGKMKRIQELLSE